MKTGLGVLLLAALATASLGMAWAQSSQTVRLRGTIEGVDGNMLTLKTTNGAAKLSLTGDAQIIAVVKSSLAEIKEGTYLGSAAVPQPDGTQKALSVHIFPEQMRGTGEGHRPYAPVPNSTMTNGTSSGATVSAVEGSAITVKYKDGQQKIIVPSSAPIVRYEIGSAADVKPGAAFTVLAASRKPDGTYEAARINVGRDGAVPQ